MKISELRGKTSDQLRDVLAGLKKELLNLRFQKATGELENASRVRQVRRGVARVKTLLRANAGTLGGSNA